MSGSIIPATATTATASTTTRIALKFFWRSIRPFLNLL